MHYLGRYLTALAICLGAVMASATGSLAQEATPTDGAMTDGCTVVADELINPRFVAIASDGTIYVTEAGTGGDTELPGAESPEGEEGGPPPTRGTTGQVTAVSPDGTQTVVASGLPSYSEGIGPAGIVLGDGVIWISTGGAYGLLGIEPLENEDSILQIDVATGEVTQIAQLGAYEIDNNPDGTDVNPNLYGMDIGADGMLYVNDAGGNTVYRVDPTTGEFALLGIVPSPVLPGADGTPAAEEEPVEGEASPVAGEEAGPPQPVPTGLHVGADGNVYVVTLGAFIPGAAQVLVAQADGSFIDSGATGLTVGIGVALGPDGSIYVSQLATLTSETEPPGPGNVVRIGPDGTAEVVVDGIPFAHGIAFDDAGNLYVVANSTSFGPPTGPGQVWRCDGIAPAA